MKPQLVLQLPGAELGPETPLYWARFNGGALQQQGHSALGQLGPLLRDFNGETLVLVPGELVLLTAVRIPTRQLRQIKQALPYMVEELIADNIEEVHMALPNLDLEAMGGHIPVAVVRHNLLINWLDQLYQHGVRPDFLGPDTLAQPWREHTLGFFFTPGPGGGAARLLFRDGQYSAQALFLEQLPVLLESLAETPAASLGPVPRSIASCGIELAEQLPQLAAQVEAKLAGEVELVGFNESTAEVLATTAVRRRGEMINLLQGGYRQQREGEESGQWWRALQLVAAGLALFVLVSGASGLWFRWQAQQLEDESFALYRQIFPDERRVVSPRKQMAAQLQGAGIAGASPLPLLATAAGGLEGSRVDELRYRRERNQLQLQLQTASIEALESIQRQLAERGLQVEINSAAEQGGATVGRLIIGGTR